MKLDKRIIAIVALVQAAILMGVANAGTINNADIIVNGQLEQFDSDPANNWYTFTLSSSGGVLVSGKNADGGGVTVEIFDSNLSMAARFCMCPTATAQLEAGDYFLQIQDNDDVGTFTFSSTLLKPECGAPSPDYTAGYNAGEKVGGGFYVIPIPVKAK